MSDSPIKLEVADRIATITMDNPPVNAHTPAMVETFIRTIDSLNDMPEVRCAIVTGAGKIFSGGADIKGRLKGHAQPGDTAAHLRRTREASYCMIECYKPIIAAVNGPALGAGLGIAISADIILASENAVFGLPEIDVGLMGGARHTMRIFGHSLARRMILTGYRVPASELYRLGIIEACTTREGLMPAAMEIARNIASKSPAALRLAKRAISTVEGMTLRDGYRFEQNLTVELTQHEDSKEAMRAFLEKRPPNFKDV